MPETLVFTVIKIEDCLTAEDLKEPLQRQVRRGGRMMLIADIVGSQLPTGRVTVVATHLEDKATPANRRKQLDEVLDQIRNSTNPVIFAGDMNTSTHDAAPVSVRRALKHRFGSGKWWAESGTPAALTIATPVGWVYEASHSLIGVARGVDDPTILASQFWVKTQKPAFSNR